MDHEVAADREHRGDRERRHEQQQRQVARLDARLLQHPVPHGARTHAEAVAHVLLATERLHHLDADDCLVRRLGEVSLALLDDARDRRHLVREAPGQVRDGGHRDACAHREQRVDREQDDRRADDHHRALAHLDDAPADEVAHGVEVVRRARDDLTGRVSVVERARIGQVGGEQPAAHLVLDADADPRREEAPLEVDEHPDDREHGDPTQVRPQLAAVAGHDRVVDRLLHEDRDRERAEGHEQRREQAERGQPPLVQPEPEEPASRRAEHEIGWVVGVVCHEEGERGWRVRGGMRAHAGEGLGALGREAVAQRSAGTPRPAVSRAWLLSYVAKMSLPSGVRAGDPCTIEPDRGCRKR